MSTSPEPLATATSEFSLDEMRHMLANCFDVGTLDDTKLRHLVGILEQNELVQLYKATAPELARRDAQHALALRRAKAKAVKRYQRMAEELTGGTVSPAPTSREELKACVSKGLAGESLDAAMTRFYTAIKRDDERIARSERAKRAAARRKAQPGT